jgi:hypothetical protein
MNGPPKKARGKLASKTARKLIASAHYAVLAWLAIVFGAAFGFSDNAAGDLRIVWTTRGARDERAC